MQATGKNILTIIKIKRNFSEAGKNRLTRPDSEELKAEKAAHQQNGEPGDQIQSRSPS